MAGIRIETLGNATLQVFADGHPLLVTDPWLGGTCYFGSWALDNPPVQTQIESAIRSEYVWISHGHPDHLHEESLALFDRGTRILLAAHYSTDIADFLTDEGFAVEILPYRGWRSLGHGVDVLSIDNPEQDSILVIRTPDALFINLNDSGLWGEQAFLKGLVRACPTDKTFLTAICDYAGDMRNIVDASGVRIPDSPEDHIEGMVRQVAHRASSLGIRHYCCSSFQHHYVRADSKWVNSYKISYDTIRRYWSRPDVRAIEPFVSLDLDTMSVTPNAAGLDPLKAQQDAGTAGDDWMSQLTRAEWKKVETYFRRFETLRDVVDFISVSVAGQTRTFEIARQSIWRHLRRRRGIHFHAPRQSLLQVVENGYFDDLLLGNFMQTELINVGLYPTFTPRIAKYGGNAKVFSRADLRRFWWRYWRRNPAAMARAWLAGRRERMIRWISKTASFLRIKRPLRVIYWKLRGDRIA